MKLTATGAAKVATAQAGGAVVQLTHLAVGDGNGNPVGLPTGVETALAREVYRDQIADLRTSAVDDKVVIAEMSIPSEEGGWVVREVGIFDVDGDLFAYGNFPDSWKPIAISGSSREMVIRASMRVASTEEITLVIDDTVVIASRAWVISQFTRENIFTGGLTNQVIAKASNADGDWVWIDLATGLQVLVDSIQEVQTLAALQTAVSFSTVTTQGIAVYIEGLRLIDGVDFTIDDETDITLATDYPADTVLHAYQNDPLGSPSYLKPGLNLSDLAGKKQARRNLGVLGKAQSFFMGQI